VHRKKKRKMPKRASLLKACRNGDITNLLPEKKRGKTRPKRSAEKHENFRGVIKRGVALAKNKPRERTWVAVFKSVGRGEAK